MPIISFVAVTNGPALIARSIFDRKKRIGVMDFIICDSLVFVETLRRARNLKNHFSLFFGSTT